MEDKTVRKILVLGGTGAMGVYLVPLLAAKDYQVHVVSLDKQEYIEPNIFHFQADAKDKIYLSQMLKNEYDAIVDFLIYSTDEFKERYKMLLSNTKHYIYLSSYRVYADNDTPINEESAQLLDVSDNKHFLSTKDYALEKARQEDVLENSEFENWTIVRPAITYSKFRYQLVTLEANVVIARALRKRPIVLPKDSFYIQGTMTWAGDVAKMLSRLVLNPLALKEAFIVATSEHHTWEEIANYYHEIIGLEYVTVDTKTYLQIMGTNTPESALGYQLRYDRYFNRIIDNSKVLQVTGLRQTDLMPLKNGLTKELTALPPNPVWIDSSGINERMDTFFQSQH